MFYDRFEDRVQTWRSFRQQLETHDDPLNHTIEFWNQAPISSRTCDPYDQSSWLGPWELIQENEYCDFSKLLAIYYTLVLTDRFSDAHFEIAICLDRIRHQSYYLLYVDEWVIGYHYDRAVDKKNLPETVKSLENYTLSADDYH